MSLIGQVNNMLRMPEVARFLGFEPDKKGFIKSHSIQKKQHRASYTISPVQGSVIFRQVRVEMWFPLWQKHRT